MTLPHHERIEDPNFRRAVNLIDTGNAPALRDLLYQHPDLIHQHVAFPDDAYFQNPTPLEFIAENPIRRGTLPANIVEIASVLLDARPAPAAINETLTLVATGRIPREQQAQIPLIDLLCTHGADPAPAALAAALHTEFEAVHALLRSGAPLTLPLTAALGDTPEANRLLPAATPEQRHLALVLAADHGHLAIVRLLLDAGESPNHYNPAGAHAHTTPLHQAAWRGHAAIVHLFLERGARLDLKDALWQGTPADWAHHGNHPELETLLRARHAAETHTSPTTK